MGVKSWFKKITTRSQYNEYDLDGDGVVSDEELNTVKSIHETEMQEEKADAQRRMDLGFESYFMLVFTVFVLFYPVFPDLGLGILNLDLFNPISV